MCMSLGIYMGERQEDGEAAVQRRENGQQQFSTSLKG